PAKPGNQDFWQSMAFKGIKLDLKTGGSGAAAEASLRDSAIFAKCNVTLEEKISQLFESQSDAVFQFLAAVFGGADVGGIEDVTQEAFFRLYRALQRGEQIENM